MPLREIAASLYPWDLADLGVDRCLDDLVGLAGVTSVYLVGVMHQEKRPYTSLCYAHNPRRKYYLPEDSRLYYHVDAEAFRGLRLLPQFSERDFLRRRDFLEELIAAARSRGLKVGVEISHTFLDATATEAAAPDAWQQGYEPADRRIGHADFLHPDVRACAVALFAETARAHNVDFLQTCVFSFDAGLGSFPRSAVEVHHAPASVARLLEVVHGVCFGPHAARTAAALGYDWERIRRDVGELRALLLADRNRRAERLVDQELLLGGNWLECEVLLRYPGLADFLRFRRQASTAWLRELGDAACAARPGLDFRYNNYHEFPALAGLDLTALAPHLGSLRDSDYSEQFGADFAAKTRRLKRLRLEIGPEKPLLASIAIRPGATPEIIHASLANLASLGVDGISLGHYDGTTPAHLRAVRDGLADAGLTVTPAAAASHHGAPRA